MCHRNVLLSWRWFIVHVVGLYITSSSAGVFLGVEPAATEAAKAPQIHAALAAFNRGCALLEKYEYSAASKEFENVLTMFPDWTAAKFNLALAYLNMMESSGGKEIIQKAEELFRQILSENPKLTHAWYCLGIFYEHIGEKEKALEAFKKVYDLDPRDPHTCFKLAEAYLAVGDNQQAVTLLERAVALDPGFVSAVYRLAIQYQRMGQREKAMRLFERFRRLNEVELAGGSFTVRKIYGSAGKYYSALGPDMLPIAREQQLVRKVTIPILDPEPRELGTATVMWQYGQVSIQIPGVAVGDLNADGILDVVITGQGQDHSAQIWFGDGKGGFSAGPVIATSAVCCTLGDVDNDGDLDLWVGGAGFGRLFENDGQGRFKVSQAKESSQTGDFIIVHARVLDIDSDGDLDLFASQYDNNGRPEIPILLINNRDGTFADGTKLWGLDRPEFSAISVIWSDLDNDRDLDVIFGRGEGSPLIWVNDRAGAFRIRNGESCGLVVPGVAGMTAGDVNCDGRPDVVILSGGKLRLFINHGDLKFEEDRQFAKQFGRLGGTTAQLADFDNDGDADLFIADAHRGNGKRGPVLLVNLWPRREFADAGEIDGGFLFSAMQYQGPSAGVLADIDGDGKLDVLLAPIGETPRYFLNRGPTGHWVELDLAGTRYRDQKSRSNESALGARAEVRTGGIFQQWDVGQVAGSTSFAPLRLHFGLGDRDEVEWLRIIWPDSVVQAEVSLKANQVLKIGEIPRKTSSCPHLFVWNGTTFEFISDFGGKGGLGYLVRPGVYAQPHPREWIPLPQAQQKEGKIICKILEPLEEVVYFDQAELVAIDHPAGMLILPHEMMPVGVAEIPDEILCFDTILHPLAGKDVAGRDILTEIRNIDRKCVGPHEYDHRFPGYAQEFLIDLEFSEALDSLLEQGQRVFFVAYGWVEYSYSQTNFAAAQAGLVLKAPTFEVFRGGKWVEVASNVGYPAGVNHWMTFDLTNVLKPGDRKIRVITNMEIYWDTVFLAATSKQQTLTGHRFSVAKARLDYRGFPKEYSPDGFGPRLLDYSSIDYTLPWKQLPGFYTRFGDVLQLVTECDNAFVIMGPGEELTLEFEVESLPPLRPGYERSWLLKTFSFCKDMDLYTAASAHVEPLPFHGMMQYPYGPEERFPETMRTRQAREIYNTRSVGVQTLPQRVVGRAEATQ